MSLITPDDLFVLKERLWPDVYFYDKQVLVIESSLNNDETFVGAGNQLGKDFVSAFIALGSFLACQLKHISCRIVTTSVSGDHQKILWGEIGRFVANSTVNLVQSADNPDGMLVMNHQEIRRGTEREAKNPHNYLMGLVFENPQKMAGHHADFTMVIGDEASGLADVCYERCQGWAKRKLFIGNCEDCSNFFRTAIEGGDIMVQSRTVA